MLLEVQCEVSTVSDDLGCHVICWCWSTVFSEGHCQMVLFHCMVRYGSVRLNSGRFAIPLQFSTAIEWAGLFTRRYNCAASTAVTSS